MDAKQNGKLPAYGEGLQEMVDRHGNRSFAHVAQGLTKREAFAMAALNGASAYSGPEQSMTPTQCARWAVDAADDLLQALEEK